MREVVVSDWLAGTDWAGWSRHALTGDASQRRYERLTGPAGQTAILMDANPDTCGTQRPFVMLARHLLELGLCAPEPHIFDEGLGLLILSDLGPVDFASHVKAAPDDELRLYETAVDAIKRIQSAPGPEGLIKMTPDIGVDMVDLAFDWAARDASVELKDSLKAELHRLLCQHDSGGYALSLRDFHAENLIWRARETGLNRVGLLDFQDAFLAHPVYDLVSLVRDVRRDVSADLLDPLLTRFDHGQSPEQTRSAFHTIAVQRNLRILGVFYRLAHQGKSSYLSLVPRVWAHIKQDLAFPEMKDLAPLVERAFSPLDRSHA